MSKWKMNIDSSLKLHLLEPYHSEDFYLLIEQNRAYLAEWLPWVQFTDSIEKTNAVISSWLQQFHTQNGIFLGIFINQKLIGSISLHTIDWKNKQASIGYLLDQTHQGKGLITKSVNHLIHYTFSHLHLHRIEIKCALKNDKSRKIPEKLGFTQEGVLRDSEYINNQFHDLVLYSLLSTDHNW
ncbi:GNAT family N-acetyltransferase [Cytobacillus kochii]|uniref:GNAT family N-acetyltransferase n=1 Tax=Cytobacillus kochii TaxID=859143 RepID=UPI0020406A92|nr:GNAT family N-acetyltransferase [Cytobacillus kochii]MCM3322157.1 GNAT family N-acetyltransferase [Cytobacillus kochii]MCM3343011.1 GNAT family N-acetyltransferase [Cytobacillus kochii]